jgi:hypothetical protein
MYWLILCQGKCRNKNIALDNGMWIFSIIFTDKVKSKYLPTTGKYNHWLRFRLHSYYIIWRKLNCFHMIKIINSFHCTRNLYLFFFFDLRAVISDHISNFKGEILLHSLSNNARLGVRVWTIFYNVFAILCDSHYVHDNRLKGNNRYS